MSGSLRLIRDDSLRILLASFVRTVDDTQSSLTQLESNFSLLLSDPYFQQNLGVWGLYPSSVKEARGLPSGARFSIDFERLRHDREFGNLAIRGYIYKQNRVVDHSQPLECSPRAQSRLGRGCSQVMEITTSSAP